MFPASHRFPPQPRPAGHAPLIRAITAGDLDAITDIYNYCIDETLVSYEEKSLSRKVPAMPDRVTLCNCSICRRFRFGISTAWVPSRKSGMAEAGPSR